MSTRFQKLCTRLRSNDDATFSHWTIAGDPVMLDKNDLSFTAQAKYELLWDAMRHNTTVSSIEIQNYPTSRHVFMDLERWLPRLATFHSLRRLQVDEFKTKQRVSASVLASFLEQVPELELLIFWSFLLVTEHDLPLLNQALERHQCLKQLHLLNILKKSSSVPSSESRAGFQLTSLIEACAKMSQLTHLQLAVGCLVNREHGLLSQPSSVSCLTRLLSPDSRLQALALRNMGLTTSHAHTLCRALETNTSLRLLNLRYNKNCVLTVNLKHLMDLLETTNCIFEQIELDWDTHSPTNEHKKDAKQQQQLRDSIEFYLALNRAGRHLYLKQEEATPAQRVQVLASCRREACYGKDLDAAQTALQSVRMCFDLLRRNPRLICEASEYAGGSRRMHRQMNEKFFLDCGVVDKIEYYKPLLVQEFQNTKQ